MRDRVATRIGACFLGGLGLVFAQAQARNAAIVLAFGGLIARLAGGYPQENSNRIGRALSYLGEIGFSIYILCAPWNLALVGAVSRLAGHRKDALPPLAWLVLVIGLIPLAAASRHFIERPALTLARRRGSGRGALAASVA